MSNINTTISGIETPEKKDKTKLEKENQEPVKELDQTEFKDESNTQTHKRNRNGRIFLLFLFVVLLIVVPILTIVVVPQKNFRRDIALYISISTFSILAIIISLREISLHLKYWYRPKIQKYTLVILFMVPVFCISSVVALTINDYEIYMHALQQFYEAFVIFAFFSLLTEILGGRANLVKLLEGKPDMFGNNRFLCCSTWEMGENFYKNCKWGTVQYAIVEFISALITIICIPLKAYSDESFGLENANTYLTFFGLTSMLYAFYCLRKFAQATFDELLSPINWHPIRKFLCIKLIIFISLIQGKVLTLLAENGVIQPVKTWSALHIASALQHYLICIEMVPLAIANSFVYSYMECLPNELKSQV